jgi:hypothetical protein
MRKDQVEIEGIPIFGDLTPEQEKKLHSEGRLSLVEIFPSDAEKFLATIFD